MGLPSRIAVTIDDHYARLTPMQKSIARYIMSNLADAAFMSIQEMAKACGVSEASILRFARALGYSGFPEFKGDVQDAFRRQVNLVTKFSRKLDSLSEGDHLLSDLVRSEMSQIDQLLAEPHDEVF
ncbi:MAG: MurR/RpiR family transcriptional regulator, partial [Firmicutes bacterium]|nr:MurR/RpiR family transcriptional regulator [Bacillota bacterium]